ncbi:MAG TPA: rRNA large subunit methyltransferase I, partial [Thermotogota bacterium]|nr:rRNA large subunit methyltransferase I [Thermotogota bacterium]
MDARIILKRLLSPRLANGHPWVYDNEIERIEGDITPGDTVDVFSFSRQWIGRGYVNPNSKIVARILTRRNERIDRDFFFKRIAEAIDYRNAITPRSTVRRLVFGEGDDLSGLIIDRLEDVFVFQFNTAGMHRFRSEIIDAVRERFPEGFFYDKSD